MNKPVLFNKLSTPFIKSFNCGMWQIAFAAIIKSVFFLKLVNFFEVSKLKNLFKVLIPFFFAILATLLDGSIPKIFVLFDLKFLRNEPSFDPISIIFLRFFG